MRAETSTPDANTPDLDPAGKGLAAFVRMMTLSGDFGRDEHGEPVGPMPWNRAQARSAVGGRTRGCGARKRARIRQWKRQRGLS